jgi:hypothetical protein
MWVAVMWVAVMWVAVMWVVRSSGVVMWAKEPSSVGVRWEVVRQAGSRNRPRSTTSRDRRCTNTLPAGYTTSHFLRSTIDCFVWDPSCPALR